MAVYESRRIHDRDAVLDGKAAARNDETRISFGDRDGKAGRNERPLERGKGRKGRGAQIDPCVRLIRVRRQNRVVGKPRDRHFKGFWRLHHFNPFRAS